MKLRALTLFASLFLAACGDSHPLAGSWSQETADGKAGMSLTFDTKDGGTAVTVHTAPRADGTHDHPPATYTFDQATGALTVDSELLGKGQPSKWAGKLDAGHIELAAADTKLKFHKGKDPHGH